MTGHQDAASTPRSPVWPTVCPSCRQARLWPPAPDCERLDVHRHAADTIARLNNYPTGRQENQP